jgi:type IV pilus assembly protein PilP
MVGTLNQGGTDWALVQTPDGTIQRVTSGNYMGQNYGKITQISDASIMLREIVPDGFGGYMEREGSVALSE